MATLSGAERIRAITDEDGMFKAFDTYPWKKDKMFLSGLTAILGDPNTANPKGTPSELATHARIFYYASRIGVTVDFNSYKDWLARHPDHTPPDILPEEYKSQSPATTTATDVPDLTSKLNDLKTDPDPKNDAGAEDTPSWQAAAPKGELYVERKAPPQVEADAEGGEPAYPVGFAEMLQMLQKGIPIPGIRQIPDTVIRDAVSYLLLDSIVMGFDIPRFLALTSFSPSSHLESVRCQRNPGRRMYQLQQMQKRETSLL
ncbi:hypothetical protein CCHR01_09824 [Colletotrichum chrysophilum]|uniref:Uncharacterized protein n=1 Tax=Colletotrichum chrysophilum TaxID=1836956 RepID=A0AAD9EGD3_9PEZI|nr:hypothetical protein CCHR01_09824 [Colletotrichum chrysophilum]